MGTRVRIAAGVDMAAVAGQTMQFCIGYTSFEGSDAARRSNGLCLANPDVPGQPFGAGHGRTGGGLFGISIHHVAKVVNQLARLGYVRSIRGIGGGIELARDPERVSVGEVVMAFEGNMHLLECVGADDVCVIESFCKLKNVLARAERLQVDYLDTVSLADVVPTRRQLDRVGSAD